MKDIDNEISRLMTWYNKIKIGDIIEDISYKDALQYLPQIQQRFDSSVVMIVMADGKLCLMHGWKNETIQTPSLQSKNGRRQFNSKN